MASLNSYISHVTGTTGLANTIEPKAGWKVYLFPRGAHAAAASAASPIAFDSAQAAARFNASDWFQVGTDTSTIRQISAVAGGSFTYSGSAVTVAQNARILRIGTTQPVVTSSNAEYQPHTTTYPRDDDGGTPNGSSSVTDANGQYQFFAADALYDILIQDSNGANRGVVADAQIGNQIVNDLTPVTSGGASLGTCTLPFANLRFTGMLDSGITAATGRTAFKFDTCNAITAGNLFSFGNTGSVKVYGDTHGGIFHSYSLPEVHNVKSAKYGAKGDGTTDDTTAINLAITAATGAADGAGGVVFFPPGIYIVTSTLSIKTRCRLVGSGERITVLRAGAAFSFNGSTDAIIRIGDSGGSDSYGRVERMTIDCNDIANSIAIYFSDAQEKAGPRDCNIVRYRVAGITASTSSVQNTSILNCDFAFSASSTNAVGIHFDTVSSNNLIQNCTFNSYDGAANSTSPAVRLIASEANFYRIHVEHHATGISTGTNATGGIIGFFGHNSIDDCISIGNAGFFANDIAPNGATVTINDRVNGYSFSGNAGGFYFATNDGGASAKAALSSSASAPSRINSPTTFGNTLTVAGAFGVTGSAHFGGQLTHDIDSVTGSTDTVSVGGRNTILLAGSTSIGTLSGGAAGQRVRFICAAGAAPIFTRGNTLSLSAATLTLGPNDTLEMTALTGGVSWVQTGYNDNGAFA